MSNYRGRKGTRQRPFDKEKFDSEWDRIFGKPREVESDDRDRKLDAKDKRTSTADWKMWVRSL